MVDDRRIGVVGMDGVAGETEGGAQKVDRGRRIGIAQSWDDGCAGHGPLLFLLRRSV
jgi:hypothetical protein